MGCVSMRERVDLIVVQERKSEIESSLCAGVSLIIKRMGFFLWLIEERERKKERELFTPPEMKVYAHCHASQCLGVNCLCVCCV